LHCDHGCQNRKPVKRKKKAAAPKLEKRPPFPKKLDHKKSYALRFFCIAQRKALALSFAPCIAIRLHCDFNNMKIVRQTSGRSFVDDNGFRIGFRMAKRLIKAGDRRAGLLRQFVAREKAAAARALATEPWISANDQRYLEEVSR